MEQTPSVGRIVHYVSRGSADGKFPSVCRAAVITEVPATIPDGYGADEPNNPTDGWYVHLAVLNPTGMFFDQHVHHHDAGVLLENGLLGGTWHWPERV